jgi:TPR repeat protein
MGALMRCLSLGLLTALVLFPATSRAQDASAHACDIAAASPDDTSRPADAPGILKTDPDVAVPACEAALVADSNNPRLLFQLGRALFQSHDENRARTFLERSAAQGYSAAQNALGILYAKGRGGLAKDDQQAARLFKLAADSGNQGGQYSLAFFFEMGRGGLKKNDQEAARLYKLSAGRGEADAQVRLALFYETGRGGLPKDEAKATRLLKLAADQGSLFGELDLALLYDAGRGGLRKDDVEAARLYKLAADQGLADAEYHLALFYEAGRGGLPRNNEEAKRLYEFAAYQGNSDAQGHLETLNANGHSHLCKADAAADQSKIKADLLQSEVAAFRRRISSCWFPPPGVDANTNISLTIRVFLNPDGSLKQGPVLASITPSSPALGHALADSALQAVRLAQPFTMLKLENYNQWKELELVFDPHSLLDASKQNTNPK